MCDIDFLFPCQLSSVTPNGPYVMPSNLEWMESIQGWGDNDHINARGLLNANERTV